MGGVRRVARIAERLERGCDLGKRLFGYANSPFGKNF
jgi:hypothetical protein